MPRGIFNHAGGSFDVSEMTDIVQSDPFQSSVIVILSGTADVLNPYQAQGNNYIINTGSADAITLAAPVATVDDGLTISLVSNTAFAHTLTSTGNFQTGGTATGVLTFSAHAGAGLLLRAYQGKWQVVGNNLVTLTS
jgi:hypothetical protein